jgi:hypothetical protein
MAVGLTTMMMELTRLGAMIVYDPTVSSICTAQYARCWYSFGITLLLHAAANVLGIYYADQCFKHARKVYKNTRRLLTTHQRLSEAADAIDTIALSILPAKVWTELRSDRHQKFDVDTFFHKTIAYSYPDVTVLFADLVNFTVS